MGVPRIGRAVAVSMALMLAFAGTAFADVANDTYVAINGGAASTDSLNVTVDVNAEHCPGGGNMSDLFIGFSNVPLGDTDAGWTEFAWTGDNCTDLGGGNQVPPATPATYNWELAAGDPGERTVYVRFRHGDAYAQDSDTILYSLNGTTPTVTVCENPAAPAWANHILRSNGLNMKDAATKNFVAQVALNMGPGTDFEGVPKDTTTDPNDPEYLDDVEDARTAYGEAVLAFLNDLPELSGLLLGDGPDSECVEVPVTTE